MNNQKKKKQGSPWLALVILIPILMRTMDGELPPAVFAVILAGVVLAVVFGSMKKMKQQAAKQALEQRLAGKPSAAPGRRTPEVELHSPVPSLQRRDPAKSAQRNFSQPDAYCVSCELSGEDHFVRDRQRRISQLDEWLKNGLIDKKEYLVLKNRFENDQ